MGGLRRLDKTKREGKSANVGDFNGVGVADFLDSSISKRDRLFKEKAAFLKFFGDFTKKKRRRRWF
jgi:hypothetical protein